MGIIAETAKDLDDRFSESETAYWVKEQLDRVMPFVLALLGATLYLEFFVELNQLQHEMVYTAQRFILLFFLAELIVDLGIYRDNRQYFRDRWVDMMLLLPFIGLVSSSARVFKLLKSAKSAKKLKGLSSIKGVKAMKGAQHTTKGLKKARDLLKD